MRKRVMNLRTEDERNPRGIFERPRGSGVWWINYYEHGKQHREKVGRKGDAVQLYGIRKADILRGRKLPPLRRTAPVMVADLINLMLAYVRAQKHKDLRSYESRGEIVRKELGTRDVVALTPQECQGWSQKKSFHSLVCLEARCVVPSQDFR